MEVSGGDGSSIENAIKISDCSNSEGVNQEYIEVRKKFGNYILIKQLLIEKEGKMYDKLQLKVENDKEIELYFDITYFYGKWE